MTKLLIIDDDIAVRTSLSLLFKQAGYKCQSADNPESAFKLINSNEFDLVIMDMNYSLETSGQEGLKLLVNIKSAKPDLPVVLITAWGSISLAVEGVKAGAADFISKPWDNHHLLSTIDSILKISSSKQSKSENYSSQNKRALLDKKNDFGFIVGEDPGMVKILETVSMISSTGAAVLITGESGTGKELIAEAIHNNSSRKNHPFIKVNLGGISNSLFESEMFGHKKGAFTDAVSDRIGRFEMADKGTIFLDEIGELDLSCQVKLLRVLQERKFELLGSSITKNVDFRLICATNRDLAKMVSNGSFREDLYYRINLFSIKLPTLRERKQDIAFLVHFFINHLKKIYNRTDISVSTKAIEWLKDLPYSGNVRELKNLVERTVLVTNKTILDAEDFQAQYYNSPQKNQEDNLPAVGTISLDDLEKNMITKTLKFYNNNISHAAEALGLSRAALYRRMEKFNLDGAKQS